MWFDLPEKEKKEIVKKTVIESNKIMQKTLKTHLKKTK